MCLGLILNDLCLVPIKETLANSVDCSILSGSTLFALLTEVSINYGCNKLHPDTPSVWNGLVQRNEIEESISHKWLKLSSTLLGMDTSVGEATLFVLTTIWKMAYSIRKESAPTGSKFLPYRLEIFLVMKYRKTKQDVTENLPSVTSPLKNEHWAPAVLRHYPWFSLKIVEIDMTIFTVNIGTPYLLTILVLNVEITHSTTVVSKFLLYVWQTV